MPGIKISGITNEEDAKWAAILGVEYISVSMEEESDKKVSLGRAIEIRDMLPSYTGFIAEFGDINRISMREVNKLKPGYIQLKNGEASLQDEVPGKFEVMACPVIYETQGIDDSICNSPYVRFIQITLPEGTGPEQLLSLKKKYNMERVMIEGDWELADIKKACEIIQPAAWSIRRIIEKSPRKIDYEKMKEYIREISLW
ncbi:MAG: hypothetical protein ABIH89_09450 [Elusimicrobiota bacterium]